MTQTSAAQPSHPSLRVRALKAGAWTVGQQGFEAATRFISNLIMTRLLFPEAFGVISAALVLITGLQLLSDFGVHSVIIQDARGDREDFLRSAWVFLLWRGTLLWLVLCAICAALGIPAVHDLIPAGTVFADDLFPRVTAMLGFSLLVGEARSTVLYLNARRLDLGPVAAIDIACRVLTIVVMFAWALVAPSPWAIVAGTLAGEVGRTVLSHVVVAGPRMAFKWQTQHFREIIRFGKWIWVSTVGTFVTNQSDVIILGILFPGPVFGVYVIAKLLVESVEMLLSRVEAALALPVLSEIARKLPHDLWGQYYRLRLPLELAAAAAGGMLFAGGDFVVRFLYDQRYAEAGLMVQILAIRLALYPCGIIQSAFVATGDAHIGAGLSTLRAVSIVVCAIGGFFAAGPLGAIAGLALHRVIPSAVIVVFASRRGWISAWREVRVVPVFIAGAAIAKAGMAVMAALGVSSVAQLLHR